MKPILEELFYGHIFPFERIVPQDPDYRPLNQKKSDIKQTLQARLPAEIIKRWKGFWIWVATQA